MTAKEIHNRLCELLDVASIRPCKRETLHVKGIAFSYINTYNQKQDSICSAKAVIPEIGFKFEIKRKDFSDVDRIDYVLQVSKITLGRAPFQNLCRKEKVSSKKLRDEYGMPREACKDWDNVDIHDVDSIRKWFNTYFCAPK